MGWGHIEILDKASTYYAKVAMKTNVVRPENRWGPTIRLNPRIRLGLRIRLGPRLSLGPRIILGPRESGWARE